MNVNRQSWRTVRRHAGLVALLATMVVAGSAVLGASGASAHEATYSCPSECPNVSGPDQNEVDKAYGKNLSGTGVCVTLWEKVGSSYNRLEFECSPNGTSTGVKTVPCLGSNVLHGDTKRYYAKYEYYLWGQQYWETIIC